MRFSKVQTVVRSGIVAESVLQAAEPLEAQPVVELELDLLVRQVVQALDHQDADHGLGRIRRAAALRAVRTRRHAVHFRRQRGEVDVLV